MGIKDFFSNMKGRWQAYDINKNLIKRVDYLEKSSKGHVKNKGVSAHYAAPSYEVDPEDIIRIFMQDAYVRAAVNKKIDSVMEGSYYIEPVEDADLNLAEVQHQEFKVWEKTAGGGMDTKMEPVNFTRLLRKAVASLVVSDDLYMELRLPVGEDG